MAKSDYYIVHYQKYSPGATGLAKALGIKKVGNGGEVWLGEGHTLINWGLTSLQENLRDAARIINKPSNIKKTSNKLAFFKHMGEAPLLAPRIPEWTEDSDVALDWLKAGHEVLARTVINGRGGTGIVFGSDEDQFEDFIEAPLFTKYKKKKDEYRVHVLFGEPVDVQQKLLRSTDDHGVPIDRSTVDYRVRNLKNGFIFARAGVKPPSDVIKQAVLAYKLSDLDFGAIDVIYNSSEGQAYVLEINTAPGLMGTTMEIYKEHFKKALGL